MVVRTWAGGWGGESVSQAFLFVKIKKQRRQCNSARFPGSGGRERCRSKRAGGAWARAPWVRLMTLNPQVLPGAGSREGQMN